MEEGQCREWQQDRKKQQGTEHRLLCPWKFPERGHQQGTVKPILTGLLSLTRWLIGSERSEEKTSKQSCLTLISLYVFILLYGLSSIPHMSSMTWLFTWISQQHKIVTELLFSFCWPAFLQALILFSISFVNFEGQVCSVSILEKAFLKYILF